MIRRLASRLSRRHFVAAAGATAASLSLSPRAHAAAGRYDVAIVGAGLAGLNAALILTELGAKVIVLEADTRTGGRCLTMDRWPLHPDLGGAQIGRSYARVLDTARKLQVKLGPGAHINAPYSFVLNDTLIAAKDWAASPLNRTVGNERVVPPHALGGIFVEGRTPFTSLDGWLQPEAVVYDISLAEWLRRQGASPEAQRIIHESQGRPLADLNVLRMMQEATNARIGMSTIDPKELAGKDSYERAGVTSKHVIGGTSRLLDAMVASLGASVRTGKHVRSIDLGDGACEIRCADGTRVRSRFALAAIPFTVLRQIDITPSLRGNQADAVRRMPYGNQSQVWLRVKKPYWEMDGIEASMWTDGAFNLIRQQIESDGARELMSVLAFSDKSVKLDAMAPAERGRFAIAEIERIRPSTRGLFEYVGAHSWELAPYQRGCSHQFVPGRGMGLGALDGTAVPRLAFRRRASAAAGSRHGSRDGVRRTRGARDRRAARGLNPSAYAQGQACPPQPRARELSAVALSRLRGLFGAAGLASRGGSASRTARACGAGCRMVAGAAPRHPAHDVVQCRACAVAHRVQRPVRGGRRGSAGADSRAALPGHDCGESRGGRPLLRAFRLSPRRGFRLAT